MWSLKDWNFPELVTVLPVTTDVGGTSQVNVTMVPSWLGNKLESEIDGPGKRGRLREGRKGGGGNQDWRALFKRERATLEITYLPVWGSIVSFYSGKASNTQNKKLSPTEIKAE